MEKINNINEEEIKEIEKEMKEIEKEMEKEEKKTEIKTQIDIEILTEAIKDFLSLPFSFLAKSQKIEELNLNEEEKEILKNVVKPLVIKYQQYLIYSPEIMFIIVYLNLWREKLKILKKIK